jgi:hypothetical protein
MKYPLPPGVFTFNATAKTITFSGTVPAAISNIMHVTNVTRGVLYFQPQAGASFSGTYASPTLTLTASTTGHADSDKLLIVYDDGEATLPTGAATAANQTTGNSSLSAIDGKLAVPRTPTTASVASSATSVTVLTSNANRRGLLLNNISLSTLYVSFAGTATAANCFASLPPGATLILDNQLIATQTITGIWSSANGTVQVTEFV